MNDRPRGPRRGQGGPGKRSHRPAGKSRSGGRPARGVSRQTGGDRFGGVKPMGSLSLKRLTGNQWMLVAPECACERQMDLDEARDMRAKREEEIARDELLYLVADCHGFLEAHNLLGELALEENDVKLARGHFGYSYENALKALPPGFKGLLPADQGYNGPFFDAGRGLARCLISLGRVAEGAAVLKKLAAWDPEEPHTQSLLEQLREYESELKLGTASPSSLPIITGITPLSTDSDDEDAEDDDDD